MTMHETLFFVDDLRRFMEREVSNPGPWCWPTRELVSVNLRKNQDVFPRDRDYRSLHAAFNRQVDIAKARHWLTDEGCQPHCHARHLRLTAAGAEALRLMNEQGCGPQCSQHREIKLHLERKAA